MAEERKREQKLPPGTYAYILDGTNSRIKAHVGPCTLTLTNQDQPVRYNTKTHTFEECSLESAVQLNVVAPEGYYVVLTNPAKTKGKEGEPVRDLHPELGRPNEAPDLLIGQKENIPGPVDFALYPGQTAEVRRGHHLRLNEFLRIKIYNDEKAKANWSKAILKKADATTPDTKSETVATKSAPADLAVGKQYNILGTEVSFYIPPTGVSVVTDGNDPSGKLLFVRDAETLEQLEYAILVDEDGNKEYPHGPKVVFPKPTQRFITDRSDNRKFRAIEMNVLQGIQLKLVDKDVLPQDPLDITPEMRAVKTENGIQFFEFNAGEEVFLRGSVMPIYFPNEKHQIVKYDGKTIHYAVAVPEGEARYVMNRHTSDIRTVAGPTMLLPNPIDEIIVRRALSDFESITLFPGVDGTGSQEALAYNRWLRELAGGEPTARQGVVSEGRIDPSQSGSMAVSTAAFLSERGVGSGYDQLDALAVNYSSTMNKGVEARSRAGRPKMEESRQGKNQDAMSADVAERKSTFNEPRTITFAGKYKGVPPIKVRQGYAVQVANADGSREVIVGPKTKLLDYSEMLDVLKLSTGKPKTTDKLATTAYLNIKNNKITDYVLVETSDLVRVELRLSYDVSFEGDPSLWFTIENYVKHLCDHVRSRLKGKVKLITIEEFYPKSTDIIRDTILGARSETVATTPETAAKMGRTGLFFPSNGMRVTDVEVLNVQIADAQINQLMQQAQTQVVQQNISLAQARSRVNAVKQQETLSREESDAKALTVQHTLTLQAKQIADQLQLELAKFGSALAQQGEKRKIQQNEQDTLNFVHQQQLERDKLRAAFDHDQLDAEQQRRLELMASQTNAIVEQMKAVDPHLVSALESASARDMLVQVAKAFSFRDMFGADNGIDMLQKTFANTPLQALVDRAIDTAGKALNGGSGKSLPSSPA